MQAPSGIAVSVLLEGGIKQQQGYSEGTYSLSTSHVEYHECPVCQYSKLVPHKQFYYRGVVCVPEGEKSFHLRLIDAVVSDVSVNSPFTILKILDSPGQSITFLITPLRFITPI